MTSKFAGPIVFAALLAPVAAAQGEAVADPVADLLPPGRPDKWGTFRREGTGLRIETPKPSWLTRLSPPASFEFVETPYTAGGNIEYSAAYAVNRVSEPDRPAAQEAHAELSLAGRGAKERVKVSVGWRPGTGDCFEVARIHPNANGTHYNIVTFPRKSDQGRIGIVRQGAAVIFLAADGPGALVELIRYPYDPLYNPALRVSAFRGQGTEPAPVDVLFTDLTLKADRLLRGPDALAVPPPTVPPAGYPVKLDYARNPAGILADFKRSNDKAKAFSVEGLGLRVRPPVAARHRKEDVAMHWHDSRFAVIGDFEISWRVDVAMLGPFPPESAGACNVSMSLRDDSPLGSVILSRGAVRGRGDVYEITRYSPKKGGETWDTQRFPAAGGRCRLTMRRTGAELTLLAAEGDAPARELVRVPITPGPIKRIRMAAYQGGSATVPIDVTMSDLTIQAGALVDPDNPTVALTGPADAADGGQVVIESAPVVRSRKWVYLGAGAAGLLAAAAVVGLVAFARRRRKNRE